MPFDPSTATPVAAPKFDPTTAAPRRQTATSELDRDRELLRTEAGRKELEARAAAGEPKARGNIGLLADIGLEGGGATGGQVLGSLAGPVGTVIGGAAGGVLGNIASQKRRILAGEQPSYRIGEALSSAITGAIPGAPLAAGAGLKRLALEGVKQAAGGALGKTVETAVDESRLPSGTELAITSVVPAVGGVAAQRMQAADPAIQAAVREAKAGTGAVPRATLEAAQKAGYSIPQSISRKEVGEGASVAADTLESFGGKAAMLQEASIRNQKVTNSLAKKALGLPENRDITEEAIEQIRDDAAKPYAAIESMATKAETDLKDLLKKTEGMTAHETAALRASPGTADRLNSLTIEAAADVRALREARNTATGKFRQFKRSADPAHLDEAQAALARATALEDKIEAAATEFGKPEMVNQLREARTRIAKTYDVENALNTANANVDATKIAAAIRAGRPLSGELKTIGDTALAFSPVMKESSRVGAPGVSAFQIAGMLAGAGGGFQLFGPSGVVAGALPLARPTARSAALSDFVTRIPTTVDATPPLRPLATRAVTQEAAQEVAEELKPDPEAKPASERKVVQATKTDSAEDYPELTPAEAKKAAPGKFRGKNGHLYEKLPNGAIRKV